MILLEDKIRFLKKASANERDKYYSILDPKDIIAIIQEGREVDRECRDFQQLFNMGLEKSFDELGEEEVFEESFAKPLSKKPVEESEDEKHAHMFEDEDEDVVFEEIESKEYVPSPAPRRTRVKNTKKKFSKTEYDSSGNPITQDSDFDAHDLNGEARNYFDF